MKCIECNAELRPSAKFCPNCGHPNHAANSNTAAETPKENPKPSKSLAVWLVIIGIALVGTYASLFIPALIGQKPTSYPPVGLYATVWTALFFYLAWKYRGQKGWHGALIGVGIGFVVYTIAIMVAVSNNTAAKNKVGAEQMIEMVEELYDESRKVNPDGTPALIDKTFAPSEDATGSIAIMQQFMADIVNQSAAMANDYVIELDSIGITTLFDEDHLLSDPTFKKSWHTIAEARLLVDKYERRAEKIMTNARSRIDFLNVSDAEKREMRESFDQGVKNSADVHDRLWELERLSIDEMEKVIDLLAEDPQSWEIEEDQFLFDSDQDIDRFNEHMVNLEKFVAEQMELQDLLMQRQRENLEKSF